MAADKNKVTVDLTTGIGILSFPKVFKDTAGTRDDGSPDYNIQIIIPKSQRDDVRKIMAAIKKVGEAKWGDNWKKVRTPLRDGDAEADEMTEDGSLKRDKYPERLGCYFLNARSTRPVAVVDRERTPILESSELYGGCKGKINISLYPYSTSGNHGIGAGLNGVQKVADGEPIGGGGKPAVDSMFDILDDEDEDGLDDIDVDEDFEDEEPAPKPRKKAPAKKAPTKKKASEPEPEDEDDDLDEDFDEDDDI